MGKQAIKIGILEDKEKEINILEDMLYDIAEENDIKINIVCQPELERLYG